MLYDVDIEASACVLSSRYAMLCYAKIVKKLLLACLASCQPIEQVANLIDLSRHVVIDLSGSQLVCNPKKLLETSWKPGWQLVLPVECGPSNIAYVCWVTL